MPIDWLDENPGGNPDEGTTAASEKPSGMSETEDAAVPLVAAFRSGDREERSDVFSALSHLYRPLLESMVSRYYGIGVSAGVFPDGAGAREELLQEARIGLCHAAAAYTDDRHTTFGLFAKICIRNRLVSYLRREHGLLAGKALTPSADGSGEEEDFFSDPEDVLIAKEAFSDLYRRFSASLTPYERSVFHLYIAGASYRTIAARLGVPEKSVDNAVFRVRRKLRDAMR